MLSERGLIKLFIRGRGTSKVFALPISMIKAIKINHETKSRISSDNNSESNEYYAEKLYQLTPEEDMLILLTFESENGMIYLKHLNSDIKLQFEQFPIFSKLKKHPEFVSTRDGHGISYDFDTSQKHFINQIHPLVVSCLDLTTFDELSSKSLITINKNVKKGKDTEALIALENQAKLEYSDSVCAMKAEKEAYDSFVKSKVR